MSEKFNDDKYVSSINNIKPDNNGNIDIDSIQLTTHEIATLPITGVVTGNNSLSVDVDNDVTKLTSGYIKLNNNTILLYGITAAIFNIVNINWYGYVEVPTNIIKILSFVGNIIPYSPNTTTTQYTTVGPECTLQYMGYKDNKVYLFIWDEYNIATIMPFDFYFESM